MGNLQISVKWQCQGVLKCVTGPLKLNKAHTMRSNTLPQLVLAMSEGVIVCHIGNLQFWQQEGRGGVLLN